MTKEIQSFDFTMTIITVLINKINKEMNRV